MPLTYYERKERLRYGDVRKIAADAACSESFVSGVLRGTRRNRRIERLIASRMREPMSGASVSVTTAFGPEYRKPTLQPETER